MIFRIFSIFKIARSDCVCYKFTTYTVSHFYFLRGVKCLMLERFADV